MTLTQLYDKISAHLTLTDTERKELVALFTDPNSLQPDDDMWDGQDVCKHFDCDSFENRRFINSLLAAYVKVHPNEQPDIVTATINTAKYDDESGQFSPLLLSETIERMSVEDVTRFCTEVIKLVKHRDSTVGLWATDQVVMDSRFFQISFD